MAAYLWKMIEGNYDIVVGVDKVSAGGLKREVVGSEEEWVGR